MTVNVSLCGSIPRSQMMKNENGSTFPEFPSLTMSETKAPLSVRRHRKTSISEASTSGSSSSFIEPPQWAVPASGDASLEPIGETRYSQSSVDLSKSACTTFGRSQSMDVQLLNETSSRRHAIMFHHPNGSCYVVDCGSAHGTFVNGIRVKTQIVERAGEADSSPSRRGTVIPHRVKKGAIIRFGGVGAPTFVLKSFSVTLDSLIKDVKQAEAEVQKRKEHIVEDDSTPCSPDDSKSYRKMIALNTRLNAIGDSVTRHIPEQCSPSFASAILSARSASQQNTFFLKKRSLSTLSDSSVSSDASSEIHVQKKRRILTTKEDSGEFLHDAALISPSRSEKPLFLPFNLPVMRPVVSPNPLEEDSLLELDSIGSSLLSVPLSLSMGSRKKKRRVQFCEKPEVHHPPSVTPEESCVEEG